MREPTGQFKTKFKARCSANGSSVGPKNFVEFFSISNHGRDPLPIGLLQQEMVIGILDEDKGVMKEHSLKLNPASRTACPFSFNKHEAFSLVLINAMFLDANASPSLCISIVIRGVGIEMVKLYQVRNLLSNHIGKAIQIEIKDFPKG